MHLDDGVLWAGLVHHLPVCLHILQPTALQSVLAAPSFPSPLFPSD